MNGRSSATLIFIILILKFNDQVKQLLTHVVTHCGPKVTLLLWLTDTYKNTYICTELLMCVLELVHACIPIYTEKFIHVCLHIYIHI